MRHAIPRFSRDLAADFGRVIRDVRLAYGWSQRALAARAGTSQSVVSRLEAGRPESFDLAVVGRTFETLGIRLQTSFDLPPLAATARQRDAGHARCVGHVAQRLRRDGYLVATEVEVGDGRWRGWIDILAIHPATGLLVVIEVKTELRDAGAELRRFTSYEREAWTAARRLGWAPRRRIGALLLLRTDDTDSFVDANRPLLRLGFGGSSAILFDWLTHPRGATPNGRALASFDPRSRRIRWLHDPGLDRRRVPPRYRDYADFMRRAA